MAKSYTSRFPKITAELEGRMEVLIGGIADAVMDAAKDRVPVATGALRDAIHVVHSGLGEETVVAGNTKVFYGHIVEHGSVHSSPHPFMVPAAEDIRQTIPKSAAIALRNL